MTLRRYTGKRYLPGDDVLVTENDGACNMIESATVTFRDIESGNDAVVIVRYDAASVVLCLSLKAGADVEVQMKKEEAKKIIEALRKAT